MKRSSIYALLVGSLTILALGLAAILFNVQAQSEEPMLPAEPALSAAASPLFNYQGELRNASGNPITNASMPMTFRLFTTATGGSACWSETRNVNVQNGQFNVVLGQVTAIPSNCVTGNAYLELVINGETLSPRELLTSVASAVTANTLAADAQTQGAVSVQGNLSILGNNLYMGGKDANSLALMREGHIMHLIPWAGDGYPMNQVCIGCGGGAGLLVYGPVNFWQLTINDFITSPPNTNLRIDAGAGTGNRLTLQDDVTITGSATVNGNLTLSGTCTLTSYESGDAAGSAETCAPGSLITGAIVEANLMDKAQIAEVEGTGFSHGDLLCWSTSEEHLVLCAQENDRLVMAVADIEGRPIVLGAEPVKVIGPLLAGDLLVSSSIPGYAMANNDPLPGTVIGQALEDLDGDMGLIKAMIRKW